MELVQRLALAAIVNGLRKSGSIDDAAVASIADELRSAAGITDRWGHKNQSTVLRSLAESVLTGESGERVRDDL